MQLNKPRYIIAHTAAFTPEVDIAEIDRWHRELDDPFTRLPYWRDRHNPELTSFGYHYLIGRGGVTSSGRHEQEPGSHCRNGSMNRQSIGVCFTGHGDHENFTPEQYDAFFALAASIRRRYPEVARLGSAALLGHREVRGVTKTCPGLKVDMEAFRRMYGIRIVADGMGMVDVLGLRPMAVRAI